MLKEFREFALRGSVVDMAVGIMIGAAFNEIVRSLVADVITPPIGLLLGRVDFSELFISLSGESYPSLSAAQEVGAATINYGLFINAVVNFLIVAFVLFLLVRQVNRLGEVIHEEEKPAEPTTKECPYCISTISAKATRCPHCTSDLRG